MNVLISAAGRRVRLVQFFRDAMRSTGLAGRVYASDMNALSAALYAADDRFLTPPAGAAEFVPAVLKACKERDIRLIVSVNDHELVPYGDARDRFEKEGIYVAIMGADAVRIARDKRATHAWLEKNGFPVARRWSPDRLPPAAELPFPLIVKPARGSAGVGVRTVANESELRAAVQTTAEAVVEERQVGAEFTVNVLASRDGALVCAVPHLRLEVRAGEVSKGRTLRHAEIEALAPRLVERLPGCRGPFNYQGFLLDSGRICLTEINPRFGGGYPLAHAAGARFPEWLLLELAGKPIPRAYARWEPDIVMLRYDHEILARQAGPDRLELL